MNAIYLAQMHMLIYVSCPRACQCCAVQMVSSVKSNHVVDMVAAFALTEKQGRLGTLIRSVISILLRELREQSECVSEAAFSCIDTVLLLILSEAMKSI